MTEPRRFTPNDLVQRQPAVRRTDWTVAPQRDGRATDPVPVEPVSSRSFLDSRLAKYPTPERYTAFDGLSRHSTAQDLYDAFRRGGGIAYVHSRMISRMEEYDSKERFRIGVEKKIFDEIGGGVVRSVLRGRGIDRVLSFGNTDALLHVVVSGEDTEERKFDPLQLGADANGRIVIGIQYLTNPTPENIERKWHKFQEHVRQLGDLSWKFPSFIVVTPTVDDKFTPKIHGVSYLQLPITRHQLELYSDLMFRSYTPARVPNARTLEQEWDEKHPDAP